MDISFTKEVIRFYFSFNDPYSFLIAPAALNLGKNYKIEIDYIPLTWYDKAGIFSRNKQAAAYWAEDAQRFAKKAGRGLNYIAEPMDSAAVCKAKNFADLSMVGLKFINLVFAMRWISGKDITSVEDLAEGLKFLEFDEAELSEALNGDKFAAAVEAGEAKAREDGVIGVPFFTFRGKKYFGAERLEYLEEELKSDPNLIIHHDATYAVIKPEELVEFLASGKPALILDVRIPKDFGAGHIPGSNCLPAKIVTRNHDRLDREWKIVLVDDGGVDAGETAFKMANAGFKNTSVLSGGFPAWKGDIETGLESWHDKLKPAGKKGDKPL